MKRLLLLLCGLISLVMSVHAADGDQFTRIYNGQELSFCILSESERTCALIGRGTYRYGNISTTLELPNCTHVGDIEYTLVEICESAFVGIDYYTKVIIPNSVKTIGDLAFYNCTGLTSVVIGDSVSSIGKYAFIGCSGLTSIEIPNSVKTIGDGAFGECTGLTSVIIGDSVDHIGQSSFAYCSELTSIEIPNSVKTIGDGAFFKCTGLTSVVIGNSVDSIGIGAFNGCIALTSVVIGNSVNHIGHSAFADCSELTSIEIPNSVKTIDDCAFIKCTGLTSVVIGDSVNRIGQSSFSDCSGLTSIEIPNSVKTIGDGAFIKCTGLTSVVIGNSVDSIGDGAFNGCIALTSVVIGNSVNRIRHSTFAYCSKLTSIEIPNSVKTINECAFYECTALTSVIIGDSVSSIGEYAFAGCSGLTSIEIPNSVKTIGDLAFYNCTGLTFVVIGNSVDSIGDRAFSNCSSLKKSAYPNNISNPFSSGIAIAYPAQETTIENGVVFDRPKTTLYFAPVTLSGEYTVPSTVKSIADNAFLLCKDITYIRMPATLSSIGQNAFKDCNLYDFTIPNAVKSFDMATLSGNPLKSLIVGSGVTQISGAASFFSSGIEKIFWLGNIPPAGYRSFNTVVNFVSNDQYNLENQIIYPFLSSIFDIDGIVYVPVSPSERTCNVVDYFYAPSHAVFSVPPIITNKGIQLKVIDIGAYAFYRHDYLTDISLDNNGVIDDYAFYDCTKLQSVTFGDNIPEIKNHTFQNCEVLKKVENSPALISIGKWAFSGCVGMEYFSVGNKITSFGEEAFSDCTGLTRFYSYAPTPPICGDQALDDIIKWNCTLYVPTGSEDLYAYAPQWKDFFYIDGVESGIESILADQKNNIEIFDLNGIKQTKRQEDLPAGIYIVRQGKNVKKIAVK